MTILDHSFLVNLVKIQNIPKCPPLTPPKTLNSGPKKKVIADFQTEFHGGSEKKLSFCPRGL
jgi:hypothetical protein